jgi:hypothetical protein
MTSKSEPASSPKEEVVRGAMATRDPVAEPEAVRAGVSPCQVEVTDKIRVRVLCGEGGWQ